MFTTSCLLLAAAPPTENQGANAMAAKVLQESKGLLRPIKFTKTNGQKSLVNGIEMYTMECTVEVRAVDDCLMTSFGDFNGWTGCFRAEKGKPYTGPVPGAFAYKKPITNGAIEAFSTKLEFDLTERGWRTEGRLPEDKPFVPDTMLPQVPELPKVKEPASERAGTKEIPKVPQASNPNTDQNGAPILPETPQEEPHSQPGSPVQKVFVSDDFSISGNANDPKDKSNRCFSLKKNQQIEIPMRKQVSGESEVWISFRWLAPNGNLDATKKYALLQVDVYTDKGNRIMYQPQKPISAIWQDTSFKVRISSNTDRIIIWNKWNDVEMYVDDLQVIQKEVQKIGNDSQEDLRQHENPDATQPAHQGKALAAETAKLEMPTAGSALRKAVLDGLRPAIESDLNQKVIFVVNKIRVCENWAYVEVKPLQPDSKPIDFMKTRYQEGIDQGFFGGNDTYALLRKNDDHWVTIKFIIGPTDVCWIGWDKVFKAPSILFPSLKGENKSETVQDQPQAKPHPAAVAKGGESIGVEAITADSFALIAAGEFTMGDALDGDKNAPPHKVSVSAFHMQKMEVSKAQWDDVREWGVKYGYSDLPEGKGKAASHPVQTVSWYDVVKWCNARSEMERLTPCYYTDKGQSLVYRSGSTDLESTMVNWCANGYRLPTEAEWEKAARGGLVNKRFPCGDTISHEAANFSNTGKQFYQAGTTGMHPACLAGGEPHTSPVGSFTANGYGLHDMAGNVCEWCWDRDGRYPSTVKTDPRGAAAGSCRVLRDGAWGSNAQTCRVAYRNFIEPGSAYYNYGFRCVRSSMAPGRPVVETAEVMEPQKTASKEPEKPARGRSGNGSLRARTKQFDDL